MGTRTEKKAPRGKPGRRAAKGIAKDQLKRPVKAPPKAVPLEIPQPDKARVWVRVRQLAPESPLVVHAFSEKARRQINDKKSQKARAPRGKYDAMAAFEAAKYLDDEGRDCIPAYTFKAAIVAAARMVDYTDMTNLRQLIFVEGELLPLTFERCQMHEGYVRLAGPGKPADIRHRPMYHGWSVDLTIQYNPKRLSASQVLHLLTLAGDSVGLCEGRPSSKAVLGWGRFEIDPTYQPMGDADAA
jgi:hypothetical protein